MVKLDESVFEGRINGKGWFFGRFKLFKELFYCVQHRGSLRWHRALPTSKLFPHVFWRILFHNAFLFSLPNFKVVLLRLRTKVLSCLATKVFARAICVLSLKLGALPPVFYS